MSIFLLCAAFCLFPCSPSRLGHDKLECAAMTSILKCDTAWIVQEDVSLPEAVHPGSPIPCCSPCALPPLGEMNYRGPEQSLATPGHWSPKQSHLTLVK